MIDLRRGWVMQPCSVWTDVNGFCAQNLTPKRLSTIKSYYLADHIRGTWMQSSCRFHRGEASIDEQCSSQLDGVLPGACHLPFAKVGAVNWRDFEILVTIRYCNEL